MSPLQDAPRLAERYRFDELIGLGGTARVHRATDRRTGGQVAIKILNADVDVRRLTVNGLAEIPAHPGLVGILESGVDEGRGYVVMPLVEGGSLADLVEDGPADPERVARIGAQVAAALAHLHGLDVVHRDVKPANVLLDAAGNAHLADLGVARLLDAAHVTSSGIAVGTPAYMAPEQVKGQEVHPPADVYSLGLVLLEALTGRREYAGAVLESAVARIHRRPDVPAHIPPRLRGLLVAMTADRPADRPTAAQVCARLSAPGLAALGGRRGGRRRGRGCGRAGRRGHAGVPDRGRGRRPDRAERPCGAHGRRRRRGRRRCGRPDARRRHRDPGRRRRPHRHRPDHTGPPRARPPRERAGRERRPGRQGQRERQGQGEREREGPGLIPGV
jgi:hypothetical protein